MSAGLRILVGCKRVIDYAVKIHLRSDALGVVTEGVKHLMNPFDEIAVEEAVRMKEMKIAGDVLVFNCGTKHGQETLRTALAMGADRALHVEVSEADYLTLEPLHISEMLEKVVKDEEIDLVILGKQAIDDDAGQVGQLLASRLDWPQATFASKVLKEGDSLIVTREVDGGIDIVKVRLPAVVTTDLRLNQPRYATLPNIMKAKKKPMAVKNLSEMGIQIVPHIQVLKVEEPPKRVPGVLLDSVDSLITKLKEKGLIT